MLNEPRINVPPRILVVTLFEGGYHHGVAALLNSLIRTGGRYSIWIGYKGSLPSWMTRLETEENNDSALKVVLRKIEQDGHFTNLKPILMSRAWEEIGKGCEGIIYFDPDIVVQCSWLLLYDWLTTGVCLCEDVNSPISQYHPRRLGWRRHFATVGVSLRYKSASLINGGLVGLSKSSLQFLDLWASMQIEVSDTVGGLRVSNISYGDNRHVRFGFFNCFDKTDQDALNCAFEAWDREVTVLGRDAMGFANGDIMFPHALGPKKPWNKAFLREALNGFRPTVADKAYWAVAGGPFRTMTPIGIWIRRLSLRTACLIGRFYGRALVSG